MGVFDKFLNAIRINDDDYDDDEFYDEEDDFEEEEPVVEEKKKPKKGFFKRAKKADDFLDDEEDFDDFDEEPAPKKAPKAAAPVAPAKEYNDPKPAAKPGKAFAPKVTPLKKRGGSGMEVNVIKPSSMEDTREIADTLLSGCTVVLNLEGIDVDLAQRVIDFTSGTCYAINGSLQKVSSYIFILTPSSVDISGDITDILGGTARGDY